MTIELQGQCPLSTALELLVWATQAATNNFFYNMIIKVAILTYRAC